MEEELLALLRDCGKSFKIQRISFNGITSVIKGNKALTVIGFLVYKGGDFFPLTVPFSIYSYSLIFFASHTCHICIS